ncbi:hypothetical protein SAMN05443572_11034 [Myxococcus fulvus]|uniref:Uncharacterized protein n=1 Tax=Myxococcus fulvus TaxID=33 RepID=A0A511T875_MYXFU|nr:hypothetical protein MFU01_54020 [Myxococcus fulvus]SEU34307.1 hypothetical protein SAMN05443572_11034 [Myxococcus fulvus]
MLLGGTEPDWERLTQALKKLPEDVDPVLAAGAALRLLSEDGSSFWSFGRHCQQLPAPVIRAVLERLAGDVRPGVFFLRESVDLEGSDEALRASWRMALQGLLDLDVTYGWGSKQRKAKLRGLAENPVLLQSLQTVVVASEEVSRDMLAVLTIDASEASLDALIPHVERAVLSQGWELDRLEDLRTHARSTPALDALFERMEALLQARRARSPALELARALGFGEPAVFMVQAVRDGRGGGGRAVDDVSSPLSPVGRQPGAGLAQLLHVLLGLGWGAWGECPGLRPRRHGAPERHAGAGGL